MSTAKQPREAAGEHKPLTFAENMQSIVERAGRSRGALSEILQVPAVWPEIVDAVREMARTRKVLQEERTALREEVAQLKGHIQDLQHDFAGTVQHCNEHHIEGREF